MATVRLDDAVDSDAVSVWLRLAPCKHRIGKQNTGGVREATLTSHCGLPRMKYSRLYNKGLK
jgi:hypothetical protein